MASEGLQFSAVALLVLLVGSACGAQVPIGAPRLAPAPGPSSRKYGPAPAPGPSAGAVDISTCTTIFQDLEANGNPLLVTALASAKLDSYIDNPSAIITLFEPTTAAFTAALSSVNPAKLLGSGSVVGPLLKYHMVPGFKLAPAALTGTFATALDTETSKLIITPATATTNATVKAAKSIANIVSGPEIYCNAYVYYIDALLVPATVSLA